MAGDTIHGDTNPWGYNSWYSHSTAKLGDTRTMDITDITITAGDTLTAMAITGEVDATVLFTKIAITQCLTPPTEGQWPEIKNKCNSSRRMEAVTIGGSRNATTNRNTYTALSSGSSRNGANINSSRSAVSTSSSFRNSGSAINSGNQNQQKLKQR